MKYTYNIDEKVYNDVVSYFNYNNDNRTSVIAKKLNLKLMYVNYILDLYLSKKRNYMGGNINYVDGIVQENYKSIRLKVYDENDDFVGEYSTVKDAAFAVGLKYPSCISRCLKGVNKAVIYHYTIRKSYTYIKC